MNLFENLQLMQESENKIISEFKEFLSNKNAQYIANEIGETKDGMQIVIYDGDWKHEHLYMKQLLDEFFTNKGIDISITSEEIGESDQDTFSARYNVTFNAKPKEYNADVKPLKFTTEDIEDSFDNNGIVTELRTNIGSHNELRYEIIQDGTLIFHTTDETLAKDEFKKISKIVPKEYKKVNGKYKKFSGNGELASMWESKNIRYQVTCNLATSNDDVYSEHSTLKDAIASARKAQQSFTNVKIKDLSDGASWSDIDNAEQDLKDGIVKESSDSINLSEYKYVGPATGYNKGWSLYRKIVDGKGVWVAEHQQTKEVVPINYDQVQGFEPIKLQGIKKLQKDLGDMLLPKRESNDEDYDDNAATFLDTLEKEITDATHTFMMSKGFPEDEVKDYSRVSTDITDDYVKISVGAELEYDSLFELCQTLDKIIEKEDKDAYFEPECPGRIVAYLFGEKVKDIHKEKEQALKDKVNSLDKVEETNHNEILNRDYKTGEKLFDELLSYLQSLDQVDMDGEDYNWQPSEFNAKNLNADGEIYLVGGAYILIYPYINEWAEDYFKVSVVESNELSTQLKNGIENIVNKFKTNKWKLVFES